MTSQIPAGAPSPLNHARIGRIQGKFNKGVIQYLGIKYASLENRFSDPKVEEYSSSQELDATRHGPPVVIPAESAKMEMSFIQKQISELDVPKMSDLEGLNLNITVPLEGGENLPVLVYIHGGGFTFGSSSYPHYDQSKVVELSAIMNQPIIAVNFNYRLGIPGFLSSKELRDHGFKPNRGLLDQRAALKWVRKYISGFGGDPNKITVAGQSAGAASVNFLMHSDEILFHQAILLGGSFLMMKPGTPETAEKMYNAVIQSLKLTTLTPAERVQSLLAMPQERLVATISKEMASLGPVSDGELIPTTTLFSGLNDQPTASLPGFQWCKRLFSIESQHDGTIFALVNLNFREEGIANAFTSHVHQKLDVDNASKLLEFYGINSKTSNSEALEHITRLITEIAFYAPSVKLAEAWPGAAILGHFNERNPWDGPYKGKSNHLLDIAYVWGNYNQSYTRQNWTVARALAENIVSFVQQTDDLPDFKSTQLVTVYGPSEEGISSDTVTWNSKATGRNLAIFELADQVGGLDTLLEVAQGFLNAD